MIYDNFNKEFAFIFPPQNTAHPKPDTRTNTLAHTHTRTLNYSSAQFHDIQHFLKVAPSLLCMPCYTYFILYCLFCFICLFDILFFFYTLLKFNIFIGGSRHLTVQCTCNSGPTALHGK